MEFLIRYMQRYRRRESSVKEVLIEMYLAGCAASRGHYRSSVGEQGISGNDQ
jgi:hypothetical protein